MRCAFKEEQMPYRAFKEDQVHISRQQAANQIQRNRLIQSSDESILRLEKKSINSGSRLPLVELLTA